MGCFFFIFLPTLNYKLNFIGDAPFNGCSLGNFFFKRRNKKPKR